MSLESVEDKEPLGPPAAEAAEGARANGRAGGPTGQGGLAVLRVLRHREFALFWAGQSISMIGTWMQGFAQGWVVAGLTTSATALGLVNFAMALPTLVLMPFGGVAADRMDRRRILIVTQWIMLLLSVAMGVLIARHQLQLWHVHLIALGAGIATAYDLPAYQAFYPQLVEKEDLPQAISLNQATFHGSRIVGPALAGWVVGLAGTAAAFFANAGSFLAVILSLCLIRPRPPQEGMERASAWSLMKEGLHYVRDRPSVQAVLGMTGITTLCVFPNMAVLTPYYARHVLHVGPEGLGTIMSASGAGALLGATLLLSIPRELRVRFIALSAALIPLTLSVLAWSHSLWLSVAAVTVQSLAIAQSLGISSIMVQELVPDALRGRVMSLYSLMFTGIMPFAALLIPGLVDRIGMRLELQVMAFVYGAAAVGLLIRLGRHSRAEA